MKTLTITLTILLLPLASFAQSKRGLIKEGDVLVTPTPNAALALLIDTQDNYPAVAVLTQKFDIRPPSELDAFADELVRVMLESEDSSTRFSASSALVKAGRANEGGTPYTRATDIFIDLYESVKDEENPEPALLPEASYYLLSVYYSGGEDYVHNLFKASPQPPACRPGVDTPCPHTGPWCNAGYVLLVTDNLPDPKLWEDRCEPVVID